MLTQPLRVEKDHYAVRVYRGDRLVGFAVRNAWDDWAIPLRPRPRTVWRTDSLGFRHLRETPPQVAQRTVAARAEAIAALAGLT